MTARAPSPSAVACFHDPLEDLAMDRRVAHDTSIRSTPTGLELGLDEDDDRGVRARAERAQDRPENETRRR